MAQKPGTKNFSGPIPIDLKDRIDDQLQRTRIPIGLIVERLAEYWADLDEEEQKLFCFGVNRQSLVEFVDGRIREFLEDPEGLAASLLKGARTRAAGQRLARARKSQARGASEPA